MKEELVLIDKYLDQIADIMNAVPDQLFRMKESETLIILQRRLNDSDLKNALVLYDEIFAKTKGADIKQLCQSAVAYVRMKTLVENDQMNFDAKTKRELIKEYKNQMIKISNIIHLSKANSAAAEEYQKEVIQLTLQKNEAFLEAFQKEIVSLEKQIERLPEEIKEPEDEPEKKEPKKQSRSLVEKMLVEMERSLAKGKQKREVESKLREVERTRASTRCEEIPFYDKSLAITEQAQCKDIPAYCVMKRKNNIYFGLSTNVKKGIYDNRDQSLLELTKANDEFIQFMKEDLLSGEYQLKPFGKKEKKAMILYFEFVSKCFETKIGITLTVQQYLKFKEYYNRLILKMFQLENEYETKYYRALQLAQRYITYMQCYGMEFLDEKETIVSNIIGDKVRNYIDDLELVMEHHVVDVKAKDALEDLVRELKYFGEEESPKTKKITLSDLRSEISGKLDPTPESADVGVRLVPSEFNDGETVTAEDLNHIQIKIQFLNRDHVIVDEALFAVSNVKKAVYDYLNREAFIKKIGLYLNEKEVFLYSSKNSSLSVLVLTEEVKRMKHLDQGIQGQLVAFYEEQIKKAMIEFTE